MRAPDPAVYRKAADVIRQGGLVKGTFFDSQDGRHCTVGAMWAAVQDDHRNLDAEVGLLAEMIGGNSCLWVFAWNDRPETTEQDVITLLEQAAEKLEADR